MANALEFILSLRDRLTAPAKQAKAALDGVQRSLKGVDAATGKVANVTRKVTRATGLSERQLYRWGATSRVAGRVADLLGQRLGAGTAIGFARAQVAASSFTARLPSMGTMLGHVGAGVVSLGPALLALGGALLTVGAVGVAGGAALLKMGGDMLRLRENTMLSLRTIEKSPERAGMAFEEMRAVARSAGLDTVKTITGMTALMSKGFSATAAKNATFAMADLKVISPGANTDAITLALGQVKSKGRLAQEELTGQLGEAGLNLEKVYEALGRRLGKSRADVMKEITAGKVDGDTGIAAILESIQAQTGKALGGAAQERALTTADGAVENLMGRFQDLFLSIRAGSSGGGVATLANQLASMLDPGSEGGQRLLAVFDRIAAVIGQLLDSLSKGTLGAVFDGLLTVMETLLPIGLAFWDGLSTGFGEAFAAVKQIFGAFSGGQGPALQFAEIARDLGKAFAFVAIGIGSVVALLTAIGAGVALVVVGIGRALVDLVGWVGEMAAEWGSLGLEIASALVKGLVDGITGGIASVVDAVGNLGTAAIDGLKSLLRIKSPSRVMAELGGFTAEGFAQGVTAGAPDASSAVERMVGAPQVRSWGGAGGGAFSMGDISIAINGVATDDAEAVGAAVRDQVEEAMRQAFQRWAGELGAAPQGA